MKRLKTKCAIVGLLITIVLVAICFIFTGCVKFNIEDCMPSVIEILILDSEGDIITQGTGFCLKNETSVVSVSHLFDYFDHNVDSIKGYSLSGEEYLLNLIKTDSEKDIALLEIVSGKMTPFTMAKENPKNLDEIYVIGNSRGYGLVYNKGIVAMSSKSLNINGKAKTVMQTNLTINHGDSGAPILNNKNQLVGMMSFNLPMAMGKALTALAFQFCLMT